MATQDKVIFGRVLGVIQVLGNADGGGCQDFRKKALRRCKVQCISVTRGWEGVQFPEKKCYVTLE